jgi:chemotaxis protein MotB
MSYADLVTLLLAFFTTLYAASSVDGSRVSAEGGDGGRSRGQMEELRETLDETLAAAIDAHRVDVTEDIRGLVVSLPEDAAFPVGSTTAGAAALDIIALVADSVRDLPNPIRIEGHTDDVPIRTPRYESNWELSTARAAAVVAYLVKERGIDPSRLSAAGYGEFHPRVPNDSAEHRARNRRIDIVVLENSQLPSNQPPGALGVVSPDDARDTPSASRGVELGVGSSR